MLEDFKESGGNSPEINGSTRGVSAMRVPKALAALVLSTSLEVSARDLAKIL